MAQSCRHLQLYGVGTVKTLELEEDWIAEGDWELVHEGKPPLDEDEKKRRTIVWQIVGPLKMVNKQLADMVDALKRERDMMA